MDITRRDFGKFAIGSLPMASVLLTHPRLWAAPVAAGKPDSVYAGVQVGVIVPYSYHGLPSDAHAILADMVGNGLSACEMMSQTAEPYAGAPAQRSPFAGTRRGAAGARRGAGTPAARRGPGGPGARGRRQTRPPLTPAQLAARAKAQAEMTKWRLSVPMAKYEALAKLYDDAGVRIYGFKLGLTMTMPDAEFDYAFNVTKALGANQLTMEMPDNQDDLTARIGRFAAKHKIMVGYHAHTQALPTTWDKAMWQSEYNGINLDIGHYTAAGNHDAIAFVEKNYTRITSMHLKDRCFPTRNNGANEPWGQGDTPLKQALLLMRDRKYKFPGTIELEYRVPDGSTSAVEVNKCREWARTVLLS